MHAVDFLPVGDGERSGDAITLQFNRPDNGALAHVVIDAGFAATGKTIVSHVNEYYGTRSIDLAILTHPDGDHIGGMGEVIRNLDVDELWLHRLSNHGGSSLPASSAVEELITLANHHGTKVYEVFAGACFGGALTVLGPTKPYYVDLVTQQVAQQVMAEAARSAVAASAVVRSHIASGLPDEVPFDDDGGTNPRNNSSFITLLETDGKRFLFTADAGVPALDRAWDWLEERQEIAPSAPDVFQVPHHGSRHNVSSGLLDRILGPLGQPQVRSAIISVAPDAPKHPSPRVVNAVQRRGYHTFWRDGDITICSANPPRPGWVSLVPKPPLDESQEE